MCHTDVTSRSTALVTDFGSIFRRSDTLISGLVSIFRQHRYNTNLLRKYIPAVIVFFAISPKFQSCKQKICKMPEDNVESEGSYSPIPEEKMETKEEKTETKYLSVDTKIDEQKGEKYLALEAEEEKTWWDNQTNRTIVAVFISIAFIALIAALVFLLPCTEDNSELTTNEPNTTVFTEILTGYEE
ncbi:uncharacterized protein [Apostichopus japonicus]|uniref:uncharacterized protein n=1 Tax=Stichopus japonicus TaxID=307972 RepID=UPI003AB469C5